MSNQLLWDQRFLRLALEITSWSKDQSTKVACVVVSPDRIIRATGYNGLPRGINDDIPERHVRPIKYNWFEHAERNAIFAAARQGISVSGCTIYLESTPIKFPPCADCARAIIQSGIVRVVHESPAGEQDRWKESCQHSLEMFAEAGVTHDLVEL